VLPETQVLKGFLEIQEQLAIRVQLVYKVLRDCKEFKVLLEILGQRGKLEL
jgi:hypothetical protein